MMLKTSSNKINPFSGMLKFSFKRNIGIIILVVIGFLLICPAYMLIGFKDVGTEAYAKINYFNGWSNGFSIFCIITTSIAVVAINLLNFSFMYKRSASDFTDSLPITRTELFFSKLLSGYALSMIPTAVSCISLMIISLCFGFKGIALDILINILYIAVITAVCSTISMIFIVASANAFDFVVSFVGINAGIIAVGLILVALCEELLIGYTGNSMWTIFKAMSPLFYSFYGFGSHIYEEGAPLIDIGFILKNILMVAVSTVISVLLYKKRKTESTGKAFAYKFIYFICAVLISSCAAFLFGGIFADGIKVTSPLFYIFALIGGLVSSVAYGAITFRGFKTVKRSIVIGAVSFILIPVIMILIKIDFTGFNTRIPNKNQIEEVSVHYQGTNVTYTNPDFAMKLHKKIITQDGVLADKNNIYGTDVHVHTVELNYTLKNNKTLQRTYWVFDKTVADEVSQMLKSDERFDRLLYLIKKARPQTVNFYDNDEAKQEYKAFYLTYDEYIQFLSVYRKELKASDKKLSFSGNYRYYNVSWSYDRYYYDDFYYDDDFTETKKFMDGINIKERVEKFVDAAVDDYADKTATADNNTDEPE